MQLFSTIIACVLFTTAIAAPVVETTEVVCTVHAFPRVSNPKLSEVGREAEGRSDRRAKLCKFVWWASQTPATQDDKERTNVTKWHASSLLAFRDVPGSLTMLRRTRRLPSRGIGLQHLWRLVGSVFQVKCRFIWPISGRVRGWRGLWEDPSLICFRVHLFRSVDWDRDCFRFHWWLNYTDSSDFLSAFALNFWELKQGEGMNITYNLLLILYLDGEPFNKPYISFPCSDLKEIWGWVVRLIGVDTKGCVWQLSWNGKVPA